MKKIKVLTLTLVLIAMGMFVATVNAAKGGNGGKPDKPGGKPVLVEIVVTGLDGEDSPDTGHPKNIRLTLGASFVGSFVNEKETDVDFDESGWHVANPDGDSEALRIYTSEGKNKILRYYYCTADVHEDGDLDEEGRCNHLESSDEHNPEDYRALFIYNGKLDKKAGIIVFPEDGNWVVMSKAREVVARGTLGDEVIYQEIYE